MSRALILEGGRQHCLSAVHGVTFIDVIKSLNALSPRRRFRLSLIRHALFGEDSVRFAATLGMCA